MPNPDEITNTMLSAGLDAMKRHTQAEKIVGDMHTNERIRLISAIYRAMVNAADEIVSE